VDFKIRRDRVFPLGEESSVKRKPLVVGELSVSATQGHELWVGCQRAQHRHLHNRCCHPPLQKESR